MGAAVVAVAAAAGGWVVLRRRRQRSSHAGAVTTADAADKLEVGSKSSDGPRLPPGSPPLSSSGMGSPLFSTAAQLPTVLAEAGLTAATAQPQSTGHTSWHRRLQASAGTASSTGVPKNVVSTGQLLCGRPVAASPFSALKPGFAPFSTPSPFASRSSAGGGSPDGGGEADWLRPPPGAVLAELVAQRAMEDQAPAIDSFTVGCTSALPSGSLSGGTAASDGNTQLSSRTEGAQLGADALPPALQSWLIPADDIQVLERPGRKGEKWVLGEGARCGSGWCGLMSLRRCRACIVVEPQDWCTASAGLAAALLPLWLLL